LKADELGLLGWVRNLADGRVELMAHGDDLKVGDLIKWIERGGPPSAEVNKVEITEGEKNFELDEFYIRRED